MNVIEKTDNDISILTLDGRIDSEGAVDLDLALQSVVSDGKHKIILDMEKVTYINSAGLRTLADILNQTQSKGGNVVLLSLNARVQRVLEIIGFDNFFSIAKSLDAAKASF